ncbi:hypothetical protein MNEG_14331, partial [Monoraphidium neglectum]
FVAVGGGLEAEASAQQLGWRFVRVTPSPPHPGDPERRAAAAAAASPHAAHAPACAALEKGCEGSGAASPCGAAAAAAAAAGVESLEDWMASRRRAPRPRDALGGAAWHVTELTPEKLLAAALL